MPELASALPKKHFFLEMFTRDISLEDCILDLIDNSIDALVKTKQVDISSLILTKNGSKLPSAASLPLVEVEFSEAQFKISDNCGGITYHDALNDVFNFGHGENPVRGQLGAYGIGLKRALFKIGNDFLIESHARTDGFKAHLKDVRAWAAKDETLKDWSIPITQEAAAASPDTAGTSITIRSLRKEVQMRIKDGTVEGRLRKLIGQTYALYLGRYVRVKLNDHDVTPADIPIGQSKDVTPAHDEFEQGGVKVKLFASLSAQARAETAGWYVFCNGRVVVHADKTDLTGWSSTLQQFHTKFVRFLGLAFFEAADPLALPWTTTKRGLNRESPIFQQARNRMAGVSSPILEFLSRMYPADLVEEPRERKIADGIQPADLRKVASQPTSQFKVTVPAQTVRSTTMRIQYDAAKKDVERIRKHLRRPSMPGNKVGKHTFDHFLKTECPE